MMLFHQMRRTAEFNSELAGRFDELLADLPDGFRRTLYPARERLAEALGLPWPQAAAEEDRRRNPRSEETVTAEIIASDSDIFVLIVELRTVRTPVDGSPTANASSARRAIRQQYKIILHSFSQEAESQDLSTLCGFLKENFSTDLEKFTYNSRRFGELKEEGKASPPPPSSEEIRAADVLSDRATRTLAIAIRQASGLLVGDLSRQLAQDDRSRAAEIRKSLEDNQIITAETVVICKKTSAQIAKVPDAAALARFASEGLKCACGNSIDDEKVDTAVSISERGRSLLDGNHWFTVLLIHTLLEFDVPLDKILVDQLSGGDEMDCIADISGEVTLFELKDKEFNLGNAYSFGAKIGIIEPEHPVIVTTEYVGNDAKEHFAKSRRRASREWEYREDGGDGAVTYIEGIDNFKIGLAELISGIAMGDALNILGEVLPNGTLPTSAVLKVFEDRFLPEGKTTPEGTRTTTRGRNQVSQGVRRQIIK